MTATQAASLRALLQTFLDAVKEGGTHGAPAGVMYAAVADRMTLGQFQQVMAALESTGKVRRAGNLYFHVADL